MIVHLCKQDAWQTAQTRGDYRAGERLEQEGFIHCSRPEQILRVANSYYPGASGMLLLWLAPERLTAELRWEGADGDTFPHIYGPINLEAVVAVTEFDADADGVFRKLILPSEIR